MHDIKMKLAIIGASSGQLPLCLKANEMGLETHCFAWEKGAVCKNAATVFHPISILEKDQIVEKCRQLHINGVVSNASELTAEISAYVSEKLGLNGTPYRVMERLHNKYYVRKLSEDVKGLSKLKFYKYDGKDQNLYPCVVKPCSGSSKIGVSFVKDAKDFESAITYAKESSDEDILVEEYIDGRELSVESISYLGKHYVIQLTDKDSSAAPHFVELGHHQPANIPISLRSKIEIVISDFLNKIGYTNGASHIEVKCDAGNIYLIEANLRGGGDEISNRLVQLSSGIDYLRCMIEVALNTFIKPTQISTPSYAGIYFLCKQTSYLKPFFEQSEGKEWLIEERISSTDLKESHSNYEHNGYLIYKSDRKIIPQI